MNWESEWFRIELIRGSRRISNFFWAFILLSGAPGFPPVGLSSYFGKDLISFLSYEQIVFILQGIVMCFYGIAGSAFSLYLWGTIFWNIGSGYNKFDKGKGIVCIYRWGFLGKNRRIRIESSMKDIEAIGMEVQEGFYPRRTLRLKIKGQQDVPLTYIGENLTLREIEEEAAELARFLQISIEGF
uniref:Photosystem I assembly protein Ycf4 n=2 Tax=Anthoceros TaxID=3233 RepID=A0A6M8AZ96_ANTPU|nr:Ycf4 protein [Anthoceros punctatus]YP_009863065.1 Ycf4 protein [Anthoceros agrestis]QKD76431.1 Ycf4 protein [Anthoceros punctatus]QKD76521.1 Ycf4 protein [Anthoceros agrestis]